MSVFLVVKEIALGNGGVGLPGSLTKLKLLDILLTKQNSPQKT